MTLYDVLTFRSDTYGRRFLIIFPLLGFVLLNLVCIALANIDDIPSDYLLFECVQVINE